MTSASGGMTVAADGVSTGGQSETTVKIFQKMTSFSETTAGHTGVSVVSRVCRPVQMLQSGGLHAMTYALGHHAKADMIQVCVCVCVQLIELPDGRRRSLHKGLQTHISGAKLYLPVLI